MSRDELLLVVGRQNFRLTGTRYVDNPLYGLFPVRCSHGRVDHNDVSGSFDSGVYVGQCSDVLVDHNVAHDNTIGLEVELSTAVVVEDNVSTDNAIGALVQISPAAPRQGHPGRARAPQRPVRATTGPTRSPRASWELARRRRDRQRRRRRRADPRQRGLRQPQRRGRCGEPAAASSPSTRPSTPIPTAEKSAETSRAATATAPPLPGADVVWDRPAAPASRCPEERGRSHRCCPPAGDEPLQAVGGGSGVRRRRDRRARSPEMALPNR